MTTRAALLLIILAAAFLALATVYQARGAAGDFSFTNETYLIEGRFLLVNENNVTVNDYVYVSLPQNTTFQRSYVLSIEPRPIRYDTDEDGNRYAVVLVTAKPGEKIWIHVRFRVRVSGYVLYADEDRARWPSFTIEKKYTTSTGYWDIYNETLIDIAYSKMYSDNPVTAARNIADWIVPRVAYSVNMGRYGSDHALIYRYGRYEITGDCVEVADMYVTFARILGLPARTAYGFLLMKHTQKMWLNMSTVNKEGESLLSHWGGHMWPQVYVAPWGWVDVDMLDGMAPNFGIYSERHILFGVEETKYYGTALTSSCVPSYMTLQYVEYTFKGETP